ncbi:hypothetical protein QTP88_019608 [Uroleucon formosanum]
MNNSYSSPQPTHSNKTFAEIASNTCLPKMNQAIVFNSINNIKQIDYVTAISKTIPAKNIQFVSRISNNRFCVFFNSQTVMENLLKIQSSIQVNGIEIPIRRLINTSKRIILSNVYPTIPNQLIIDALHELGIKTVSQIRAGFATEQFSHILSFRRQIYISQDSMSKLPSSITVTTENTTFRIFINDDTVTCFQCHQTGHFSSQCTNIPNTINVTEQTETEMETLIDLSSTANNIINESCPLPFANAQNANTSQDKDTSFINLSVESTNVTSLEQSVKSTLADKLISSANSNSKVKSLQTGKRPAPSTVTNSQPPSPTSSSSSNGEVHTNIDEWLESTHELFNSHPDFSLTYNQFKDFLECSKGCSELGNLCIKYLSSPDNIIEIISTIYPNVTVKSAKNRLTRLSNALKKIQKSTVSQTSMIDCEDYETFYLKWKLTNINWDTYQTEIEKNILNHDFSFSNNNNVEDNMEKLSNLIYNTTSNIFEQNSYSGKRPPVPWWNKTIKHAIRNKKTSFNKFKRTHDFHDFIEFKKNKALVRYLIKNEKKKSSTNIWKKIKIIKGIPMTQIKTILSENVILTEPQEIAQSIGQYFYSNSSDASLTNDFLKYKQEKENFINTPTNLQPNHGQGSILNEPITLPEIELCLRGKKSKSCGSDIIPFIFLQNLPSRLRLSIGAFKSSPIISLLSLTGEPPLHFRRLKLSLNYIARILSTPNNSTILFLNKNRFSKIYEHNPKLRRPLGLRLQQEMMEINIVANEICQRENCQIPTWKQPNYRVDTSLSVHSKKETSNIIYNNLFNELIHSYSTSTQIYTDASKTEMGIGLAIVHLNETKQFKLNIYNSIYTAECLALYKGVQLALQIQDTKIDLCSDSLSALANLQSIILSEPLAILISNLLSKSSKDIQFVWIPGHCNIKGNEKADEAARNAIMSPNSELIPFSSLVDIKRNINKYCVEWWNSKWHNTSENKLREIKHSVELWPKYTDLNRKNEVILNRLRIGHTKFTHGHLMAKTDPPLCSTCNLNYSIEHIIIHCPNFNAARRDFNIPDNLYDAIGPFSNWRNIILYLKEIELYNSI